MKFANTDLNEDVIDSRPDMIVHVPNPMILENVGYVDYRGKSKYAQSRS